MKKVLISQNNVKCSCCGTLISDIANFYYDGITISEPTYREEKCRCRKCDTAFILRYDLFDSNGHIQQIIFSEDVNDPDYKWYDILSHGQKREIEKHLKSCSKCLDRLTKEQLSEAWLGSILQELRAQQLERKKDY